jgi:hypothetical protein
MSGRNPRHDAALEHLVGDLASAPLANGPPTEGRGFATQRHDLADLFGADLGGAAGTRHVGEPLFQAQFSERDRLQAQPAGAPEAGRIDGDGALPGDLGIVGAIGGSVAASTIRARKASCWGVL